MDCKSSNIIADITFDLLSSWNCMDSIVNMAFNTTTSNTDHVTVTCITIQEKLGKALLWSACCHHVVEVILSNLFDNQQVEASKSSGIILFSRLKKNFELVQSRITDGPLACFSGLLVKLHKVLLTAADLVFLNLSIQNC